MKLCFIPTVYSNTCDVQSVAIKTGIYLNWIKAQAQGHNENL